MKKSLLFGCLLILTACQDVPQERIDHLKECIARFEEEGLTDDMPAECGAVRDSFAGVLKLVEIENAKTFSNYTIAELKMQLIEEKLDSMVSAANDRRRQMRGLYDDYMREAGLGILLYGRLPKDKARSIPKELKDNLQQAANPIIVVRELRQAENTARAQELLSPRVKQLKELNGLMKSWLPEQIYDECVKKVEDEIRKTQPGGPGVGFESF